MHTDLDEFKGNDQEGFSYTSTDTSSHGQRLGDLFQTKHLFVESGVLFVGSEFGGTLGGFDKNGSSNTTVQSGRSTRRREWVTPLWWFACAYPSFLIMVLKLSMIPWLAPVLSWARVLTTIWMKERNETLCFPDPVCNLPSKGYMQRISVTPTRTGKCQHYTTLDWGKATYRQRHQLRIGSGKEEVVVEQPSWVRYKEKKKKEKICFRFPKTVLWHNRSGVTGRGSIDLIGRRSFRFVSDLSDFFKLGSS